MTKHSTNESGYANFNKRMGLSGSESTHDLKKITGKACTFSSDATSDVKPTMIPVKSIANFEELTGRKKTAKEGHIKEVAYFAAEGNLMIDKEFKVDVTRNPVIWNYDRITFQRGGSISVNGSFEFTINCTTILKDY
jgi:hypothetical protein